LELYVKLTKSLLVALSLLSMNAIASNKADMSDEAIKARIKPLGTVVVAGAVAEVAGGARSGADVYTASCVACHGAGVLGAPKLNDAAGWTPRLEKGMDALLSNAINGINAMPPKGTCMNCSDDEIKAAIEHMIAGL
jgi:cytochrome c5